MVWWVSCWNTVGQEWYIYCNSLFGARRWYLRNGEKGFVNLFEKGDKEDPGNYRGITLMIGWNNTWMKVKHYMEGKLALEKEWYRWCVYIHRVDWERVRRHDYFLDVYTESLWYSFA